MSEKREEFLTRLNAREGEIDQSNVDMAARMQAREEARRAKEKDISKLPDRSNVVFAAMVESQRLRNEENAGRDL